MAAARVLNKMPQPSGDESQSDFMGHCVPAMMDEGHPNDQAVAMCLNVFSEGKSAKTGASPLRRVVTLFETKQVNEELREIEGIASTPTVDRMGDVVVSKGAQFRLPLSLLWQHQHDKPVGEVYAAKATDEGIVVKARIFKAQVSEVLKARLDEAWESLKLGLVKGLSIGFSPLAAEPTKDLSGYRYLSWEWLELSLVTIPANIEATIATVKSFDSKLLAASGRMHRRVALINKAGVSAPIIKEVAVNIPQQIQQLEATRGAKVARLNSLSEKASAEGRTKDEAEKEEFDTLSGEIESIDSELIDQRKLEKINLAAAKAIVPAVGADPVAAARERSPYITMERRLPKGTTFTRYVMALCRSRGNLFEASEYAKRWADTPEVSSILKTAVTAGSTTDADWAAKLVDYTNMADEFIDLLRPMTILGKFGQGGIPSLRRVPFNIRMATQTGGGTYGWVGQGAAKPVGELVIGELTMTWAKAAGIIVVTDELMRFSNPNVEGIVRNDMLRGMAQFSDAQFIDPDVAAVSTVSPASITNGVVSPVSSSGSTADDFRADFGTLLETYWSADLAPTSGVFVMSNRQAMRLSLMRNALGQKEFPDMTPLGGVLEGFPVIASEAVPAVTAGDIIVFLNADDVFYADDGPVTIDASREASLQMDTAPDNPTSASTVMISLWQRNMIALRAERYMNWKLRRAAAVNYIEGASYGTVASS